MIDFEKIRQTLVEFFEEATDLKPFIIEDQAAHRPPDDPYGMIKVTPVTMEGQDSEVYEDAGANKTTVKTEGQRELLCSVNIFRGDAVQKMTELQTRLQSKHFKERIKLRSRALGQSFAIIDALSIQDLSALIQSEYESRAQMDVRLRAVSTYSEDLDTIGSVTLDGEVKNVADVDKDTIKTTISDS